MGAGLVYAPKRINSKSLWSVSDQGGDAPQYFIIIFESGLRGFIAAGPLYIRQKL